MTLEHRLDVSKLEPCEPLEQILQVVTQLNTGEYLCVQHRMEPHPLYPILTQQGYAWLTRPGHQAAFEIRIWRCTDNAAEKNAKAPIMTS